MASETVRVVERALDVLFCFTDGTEDLGVSDIARQLGASKGVVHRLLVALKSKGLVVEDARSRRYRLGVKVLELSAAFLGRLDVRDRARPYLTRLRDLTGETVGLSVRAGNHRIYLDQAVSRQEIRLASEIGKPAVLYAGAASKAILAHLPPDEVEAILGSGPLEPLTDATITDREQLLEELELIRKRGFALSRGERLTGSRAIAAPVFSHTGEIYALNITGPLSRFTEEIALGWAPRLLECAQQLSRELGYVGPFFADLDRPAECA